MPGKSDLSQLRWECWNCGEELRQCMARPRFKCCSRCDHRLPVPPLEADDDGDRG